MPPEIGLTQAEQDFFATGELPPELIAEAEVSAAQAAEAQVFPEGAPAVVEIPPAPAPVVDNATQDAADAHQRALQDAQERAIRAETRLQEREQLAAEKPPPQVEQAPDEANDPLGAMMHQLKTLNATIADLQAKLTTAEQNTAMKQQFEQFTQSVRAVKDEFVRTTPDFNDAYKHIRAVRMEDLRMVGVPEADIEKVLLQDELNIAQTALARGKNPAAEMYNMSKRYGYVPKAAVPPPMQPIAKLANIQKGQEAARQPTRSAPESELTLDSLKDAGEADLNSVIQDDKLWAKLVGGRSNDIF